MEVLRPSLQEKMEDSSSMLPSGSGEMHVLAVDDSHVDRKVIERLLKISSCKVTVVESGTRALQYLGLDGEKSSMKLNGLKVNLIMTDYSMPGMTGYELLKRIKESSAFREVPVVVMSSEKILARINRCLEEGAEEFLLKPVKLADVKRLKDCLMRGDMDVNGGKGFNKRKREDVDPTESPIFPLQPVDPTESPISPLQPIACDGASSESETEAESSLQPSPTGAIKRPRQ